MIDNLNTGGGEAADQFVRMALSGAEVVLRLGGSALTNLLAITMALARENKKVYGKISLANMLKQTRDIRVFPMTKAQYKAFKKQAKKYGILFSAIADKRGNDKTFDLILPPSELDRANQIFERILYNPELGRESPEPPRDERNHWQQRAADRVRNLFRRRERSEAETPENSPETAEPPVTVERVTIERVRENPTFPEPEIVYALPEQTYGTPEAIPMPPDFTVPSPGTEPPRQEIIETTATVLPLEPEAAPPTAVPVPVGTAERASPETPPRERAAEPPQKSQSGATPSQPDSPATSGNSTPESRTTTNPEKQSVLTRGKLQRRARPRKSNREGRRKARRSRSKERAAPRTNRFRNPKPRLRARKFRKRLCADRAGRCVLRRPVILSKQ